MARILLADDDGALRELIKRGLEKDGHDVVAACDGNAALEYINDGVGFDLLISDVEMPGMDGISLCQAALKVQPGLRLILVSGFEEQLERAQSDAGLTLRPLLKPFTLDDIRDQVSAAMG